MRAWQLGAILMIIGFLISYYAFNYILFDPNYYLTITIGLGLFFLGIAILGIKFRQWVEHH